MNTAPFSSTPAARARRHSLLAFAGRVFAAMAVAFSSWGSPDLPESDRTLAASRSNIPSHAPRFGRERALVAVVGYNAATEVTDYVVPYGILAASGVADVVAVATGEGPIRMSPALRFQAQATTSEFDERLRGSPIRRIGYERWLRNIAVGLGNAPSSIQVIKALKEKQGHKSPLVREHVHWALKQHGVEA